MLPGGQSLLFQAGQSMTDVWSGGSIEVLSLASGERRTLTEGLSVHWVSTGYLVFARESDVWAAPFDIAQGLITGELTAYAMTPDGTRLIFAEQDSETGWDIEILDLSGERVARPLLGTRFDETGPAISPDGRWLAYESNESGRAEIYVRPFPDVDAGKWPVSTGGGQSPTWGPDGEELFYRAGTAMLGVPVQIEPRFQAGPATVLFEGPYYADQHKAYDLAPDGQRFLMLKPPDPMLGARTSARLVVVLNWQRELLERVPVP